MKTYEIDIIDTLDIQSNNGKTEEIFKNTGKNAAIDNVIREMIDSGEIIVYDKDLVGFEGRFLALYTKLDNMFRDWGLSLGATEYQYPDRINLDLLNQSNYFSQLPQHFTGEPTLITTVGKCKRYESIYANYIEKLLDFTMREIIIIGSPECVLEVRLRLMEETQRFIEKNDLAANIKTVADPFLTSEYSAKRLLQKKFNLKYELNLELSEGKELSVGSYNYHGSRFTNDIYNKSTTGKSLATGCITFGIERFVYGILVQKGLNAKIIIGG